jgi:hypothetical protein
VRTENGKRKVIQQPSTAPPAKRKLINAFASPAPPKNVLKPSNQANASSNAARKLPSVKVYNVGSLIKRRSSKSRGSLGKKARNSMHKKSKMIPEIVLSSCDEQQSDTTSYEGFEVINERNIYLKSLV